MARFRTACFSAALLPLILMAGGHPFQEKDTCIAFVTTNLAKGNGNWFNYYDFADQKIKISAGDVLTYRILLDPKSPAPKGGIDISFTDGGTPFRDLHIADQNGVDGHGDGVLDAARGKWYTRRFNLDRAKGRTTETWQIQAEGDADGRYAQFIADIAIEHADGTKTWVFHNGKVSSIGTNRVSGYSEKPSCAVIDLADVKDGENYDPIILKVVARAEKYRTLDEAKQDIALVKKFLANNPDPTLQAHVKDATAIIEKVESEEGGPEAVQAALHAARHALSHTHPAMQKYSGHLVGHAHIDLQWLWEWQEGIVATRDTFNQAVKFMDEFPGFTFSQSSSCLYKAVEDEYPDIFAKMKQKIAKNQWEIVGGRVCEGDENMISAESHARQFLYGQRYFRERFGKTALVGWEPDTFGHTIQMPQILKLSGLDYYYFCRGGKDKPLFWWQALDGTKVLAFDEPASGSWYNSDLTYHQFDEMLDFEKKIGSKDMLWVYGVGNHGGGPTREYIQTALSWMTDPSKPKVKFSTATEFFKKLESYDLKKVPTVADDLNPVFDGCYTTHSEVKQLNRYAEYSTTSAESVASVASLFGFKYPKESFRRNWEEICFNHHHDTLPGSFVHPPSEKSAEMYNRIMFDNKDITRRAMETMTLRVTPEKGGISVMVFNPTGWTRSGWVKTYLLTSGWAPGFNANDLVATSPGGGNGAVRLLDPVSKKGEFYASEVPAFGYKVFHIDTPKGEHELWRAAKPSSEYALENTLLKAKVNPSTGAIDHLAKTSDGKEMVKPNGSTSRLEIHWEHQGGMSAWVLGGIDKVDNLKADRVEVVKPGEEIRAYYTIPAHNKLSKATPIVQTYRLAPGASQIDVDLDIDWEVVNDTYVSTPMLRVAFDSNLTSPKATFEVPFGAIDRETDGREWPGQNWADLSDGVSGLAVINDCKYGMSAKDSTYRLTIIRSSKDPDPNPNPGKHVCHYAIYPHDGDWKAGDVVRKGFEFQQPMIQAVVPFDARGTNPLVWSAVSISDPTVIPTVLKRGEEKGDNLILRAYQSTGAPSKGSIQFNFPVTSAEWVNLIEDKLGLAPLTSGTINMPLRGFEIKTVKVNLANKR